MDIVYPAHIKIQEDGTQVIQTVEKHLQGTADICEANLYPIGLGSCGRFIGIIHDYGKFSTDYKKYIEDAAAGKPVVRGSVNHTFGGVKLIFELFHKDDCRTAKEACAEIMAYSVMAHHGQVDLCNQDGKLGFQHRLELDPDSINYSETKNAFFTRVMSEEALSKLFDRASKEMGDFFDRMRSVMKDKKDEAFYIGMLTRLLSSALVDADRSDTAYFMKGFVNEKPSFGTKELWKKQSNLLEKKIGNFQQNTEINKARAYISNLCKEYAEKDTGICRLSVPTGSGKTLSSLRYALHKAELYGKRRIFFVIPLLSVIEQNSAVIRDYIQNDDIILEHHSNVVVDDENRDEYEYLSQNWEAPVVITTLVQLLDTLFDGKNSSVRRMTSLCNSILIIDEIQSLPRNDLSIFNTALNFLSSCCGVQIVLCSATQPNLEQIKHPVHLNTCPDMVAYSEEIWKPFKRTEIIDICRTGGYSFTQSAEKAVDIIGERQNLLMICNTKAAAKEIAFNVKELLKDRSDITVFHLSTAMVMAHRKDVLGKINCALKNHEKVICVSTQLVEAGVDFSFECVIRSLAGLDNVAQAAGRCNRNGEYGKICPVYIMNISDEKLNHLKDISDSQNAYIQFKELYKNDYSLYHDDLLSNDSIREYYHQLYMDNYVNSVFDYPCQRLHTTLYSMLSWNKVFLSACKQKESYYINQAFKTAGEEFKVFDNCTYDIIVPYGKRGNEIIEALCSEKVKWNPKLMDALIKEAGQYSISVFDYQLKKLNDEGAIEANNDLSRPFIMLKEGFYDDYGLMSDNKNSDKKYII